MVVNDDTRAAKYAAREGGDGATAHAEPTHAGEDEDMGQLTQMLEESMRNNEEAGEHADAGDDEDGGGDDEDAPRRRRQLKSMWPTDACDAMDESGDTDKKGSDDDCDL